jgi:hypothetical protein
MSFSRSLLYGGIFVWKVSVVRPVWYPDGSRCCSLKVKRTEAWSWPLTSIGVSSSRWRLYSFMGGGFVMHTENFTVLVVSEAVIAQSVQRLATGWTIIVLGFDSRWGLEIFLFTTASRTALGPTQPPIQWVPGDLSLGVKRPERAADHCPPSSAEVKGCVELYLHSPDTPSWHGA